MSEHFYGNLPSLPDFLRVTNPDSFAPAPADWYVVLTDVRGSTRAVEAGRYKQVNMIGATSIVALLNISREIDIPFVFGGDGATILIPPQLYDQACRALIATRDLARREFDLDLRAAMVPMQTVIDAGHQIKVAKVSLNGAGEQAMFSGGGLAFVEKLVKDPVGGAQYQVADEATIPAADFSGLECRWQDIASRKGETVSLLVVATTDSPTSDNRVYAEAITLIREIYGDDEECCPVSVADMLPSFNPTRLMHEAKIRTNGLLRQWLYTAEIWARNHLLQYFLDRDIQTGEVRWRDYVRLLVATSDFRKYDDAIRMVISGAPAQREQLTTHLEQRYQAGELAYGIHVSDRALMTCVVFERMGRQVHFVDGTNGGLTAAARQLKQRLAQRVAA